MNKLKIRLVNAVAATLEFICKLFDEQSLMLLLKHMLAIIGRNGFKNNMRKLELFYYAENFGVHILPVHFYSPVPNTSELTDKTWEGYDISDLHYNEEEFLSLLSKFARYKVEVEDIPFNATDKLEYYYSKLLRRFVLASKEVGPLARDPQKGVFGVLELGINHNRDVGIR